MDNTQLENIDHRLTVFGEVLDANTQAMPSPEALVKAIEQLTEETIRIGETYQASPLPLEGAEQEQDLRPLLIHYVWMDQVKAFLILLRNSLFQQLKAEVMQLDGQVSEDQLLRLKQESQKVIEEATQDLKNSYTREVNAIQNDTKAIRKFVESCKAQTNPWPTYQKQISQLPAQAHTLLDQQVVLKKIINQFEKLHALVHGSIAACEKKMTDNQSHTEAAVAFVHGHIDDKPGKVSTYLEQMEESLDIEDYQSLFTTELKEQLQEIEGRMQVSVAVDAGMIQFREINFQRNAQQWIEAEILPALQEIWVLTDLANNNLKMSMLNIRNRATLLIKEIEEQQTVSITTEAICQPLDAYVEKHKFWLSDIKDIKKLIKKRLREEFFVSTVYELQEVFLPIPLQSTLNQYKINQNELITKGRAWINKQQREVQKIWRTVEKEDALSLSEKIVRFLQYRKPNPVNSNYTNIFLTKGFIGNSFLFGRDDELARIQTLIEQWRSGYRGAVILSGKRLSGKTLFGDLISSRFFPQTTITLSPNTVLSIAGRKFTTSYDLREGLEFIQKYASVSSKYLVWIDDLELWSDPDTILSQDIRALCEALDNYSNKLFFVVSMSNWLKNHFIKSYQIDKLFQAEINLDRMSVSEIQQAILTRHGATHKLLVNAKSEEISPPQLQKMVAKIYRSTRGNIGDALNLWAFSVRKLDEEKVLFDFQGNAPLPDFITPENAVLLTTVMMHKQINEYLLRKLFGTAFREKYQSVLQRLLSVGLLSRRIDGNLEINEVAANSIGELLDNRKYLTFN